MDLMSEDLSRRETPVPTLTLISPLTLGKPRHLSQHPLPPLQKKAQMVPTKAQGEDEIRCWM